jgi:hypothetical protein
VKFYWAKIQVPVSEIIKEINFETKSALKRFLALTESEECLSRMIELKEALGPNKFKNQIST